MSDNITGIDYATGEDSTTYGLYQVKEHGEVVKVKDLTKEEIDKINSESEEE